MLDDLAWRKLPRNIIRDEELDYISSLLPVELQAAPLLFYVVAYCKADDDGSFDIQNGVIYSRLMKLCTPEQVLQIVAIMADRNILSCVYASENKNVYMFNDWDVPQRAGSAKPRTAEARRQAVEEKIRQAQQQRPQQPTSVKINFNTHEVQPPIFFNPFDDKNAKNVVKTERREIERPETAGRIETAEEIRDREIETHTEGFGDFTYESPTPQTKHTETPEQEDQIKTLADMALNYSPQKASENGSENKENEAMRVSPQRDTMPAYIVFRKFFAKNYLGFNESQCHDQLLELSKAITSLSSKMNPPDTIAAVFCGQFKKLVETPGYYQNYPLTPEELLKPGVYKTVLSVVSRILCTKNESKDAWELQERQIQEAMENKAQDYDELKAEFVKYGIDPNSKDAMQQYLLLKKETAIK